jgi:hypothetical protein
MRESLGETKNTFSEKAKCIKVKKSAKQTTTTAKRSNQPTMAPWNHHHHHQQPPPQQEQHDDQQQLQHGIAVVLSSSSTSLSFPCRIDHEVVYKARTGHKTNGGSYNSFQLDNNHNNNNNSNNSKSDSGIPRDSLTCDLSVSSSSSLESNCESRGGGGGGSGTISDCNSSHSSSNHSSCSSEHQHQQQQQQHQSFNSMSLSQHRRQNVDGNNNSKQQFDERANNSSSINTLRTRSIERYDSEGNLYSASLLAKAAAAVAIATAIAVQQQQQQHQPANALFVRKSSIIRTAQPAYLMTTRSTSASSLQEPPILPSPMRRKPITPCNSHHRTVHGNSNNRCFINSTAGSVRAPSGAANLHPMSILLSTSPPSHGPIHRGDEHHEDLGDDDDDDESQPESHSISTLSSLASTFEEDETLRHDDDADADNEQYIYSDRLLQQEHNCVHVGYNPTAMIASHRILISTSTTMPHHYQQQHDYDDDARTFLSSSHGDSKDEEDEQQQQQQHQHRDISGCLPHRHIVRYDSVQSRLRDDYS